MEELPQQRVPLVVLQIDAVLQHRPSPVFPKASRQKICSWEQQHPLVALLQIDIALRHHRSPESKQLQMFAQVDADCSLSDLKHIVVLQMR